ncbi:MAG: hypothetical protein A2Z91_04620 [Deltaproteobacteria bacterium GWA2_38_16]|nr:MAG: hypothetical protein A2Z91_04620 [Deltaproteobacteria bacterium GWA2_38_16]OGQ01714.1 MAG: hypothetical protein A3D19_07560 [Deltaproteobacteria bacterium RIFCSPHIGHO2_02_FULL_38_15]OGQ34826.1 MAG: hypothetical protein A3A72_05410 [Deltaproteobacteria bacterium RIFCSPLOWO2_01_FULL_38_9]HBQ21483.1 hypothetical protein [Deltaproteobacteria bacterium]
MKNFEPFLGALLFLLSITVIFPKMGVQGSVHVDPYTYSSQAALLAAQSTLFPEDPNIQSEFMFFEHPLLFKWLQAGFFKIFGISEFTSKALVGMMGCLLILLIFGFGNTFFSPWVGFLAGLFLLISPRFMMHASLCLLDIPLIFFSTLSITAAIFSERHKCFYLISGFALGCALLTKGSFGLLPIPIILFYLLISKKWKDLFSPYFMIGTLTPYFLILGYTFLLSRHHSDISFMSFWRTTGYGTIQDPTFYIKTMFTRYLYLTLFAFIPFIRFTKLNTPHQKSIILTLFFWCMVVIGSLSLTSSKNQGYYLLSLNPAVALLCAVGIESFLSLKLKRWIAYGVFTATLFMALVFSFTPFSLHKKKLLSEVHYWKQYYELGGAISAITEKNVLYYFPGQNFFLNFRFSHAFKEKRFLPFHLSLLNTSNHIPLYIMANKPEILPHVHHFTMIAQTQHLVILSIP